MNSKRVDGRHPWRPPFGRAARVTFRSWRNGKLRWLLLALLPLGAAVAAEDEQPSVELLEFLGGWETKDGESVDPLSLLSALLDDRKAQPQQANPEGKQND